MQARKVILLPIFLLCSLIHGVTPYQTKFSTILEKSVVNFATNSVPATYGRFYVRIKKDGLSPQFLLCGGAAIDVYWVVTSAQCLLNSNGTKIEAEKLKVGRGDYTMESSSRTSLIALDTIIHPSFSFDSDGSPLNNIGLIRLESPMNKKKPIRMCSMAANHGDPLVLLTMGSTSSSSLEFPEQLQEVMFTESKFKFTNIWKVEFCPESNICTDPVIPGTHLCYGDSGSPLYEKACYTSKYARHAQCLIGVVSHLYWDNCDQDLNRPMYECNSGNYFTSIPYFYHWITETIEIYRT